MTRHKWARISSLIILVYGLFLWAQAAWPGWDEVQAGEGLDIAKIIGGVVLVGWAAMFFKLRS